jgi:flagellar hook-basal body complex protein FliE
MPLMPVGFPSAGGNAGVDAAQKIGGASGDSFGGMLSQAVSKLNADLVEGNKMEQLAASGQLEDPTAAIVAVQKADLSLQLATQMRNKLVEGWQELSRMSV